MMKLWTIAAVIVAWIVLVPFLGVLRAYTAHDADGRVLWYELCLEYPSGADCLYVPQGVMYAFTVIGVGHSNTTVTFENQPEDSFH